MTTHSPYLTPSDFASSPLLILDALLQPDRPKPDLIKVAMLQELIAVAKLRGYAIDASNLDISMADIQEVAATLPNDYFTLKTLYLS